ncbi:MAG: D-2-hydroxyacid dehydrogenase [Bacteroidota bacterium]
MPSELVILVTYNLSPPNLQRIKNVSPSIEVIATDDPKKIEMSLPNATVIFGEVKPGYLPPAKKLRWVHYPYAGVDKALFPEFVASGITLTCSRGLHKHQMTELLFGMMLTFTRRLFTYRSYQREKKWDTSPFRETELLSDSTLGLLGVGAIGAEMARAAKGFGMRVIGLKRDPFAHVENVDVLLGRGDLPRLLHNSDHIVVILPLTPETKNLITEKEFGLMERKPFFYNLARGSIVNTRDLIQALQQGKIKGAGLDVFDEEPLAKASPLWSMENVIITPHVGGLVPHYIREAIGSFLENLSRYLKGDDLLNVVDKRRGY